MASTALSSLICCEEKPISRKIACVCSPRRGGGVPASRGSSPSTNGRPTDWIGPPCGWPYFTMSPVAQHLLEGVDRRARHADLGRFVVPEIDGAFGDGPLHEAISFGPIGHAIGIGAELRVVNDLIQTSDRAELPPMRRSRPTVSFQQTISARKSTVVSDRGKACAHTPSNISANRLFWSDVRSSTGT